MGALCLAANFVIKDDFMKRISSLLGLLVALSACQNNTANEAETTDAKPETTTEESSEATNNLPPATPEGAKVFFANLNDGDTLSSPFLVEFGIEGMEVEPAGEVNQGKGHHHIIINNDYIEFGGTVPADSVNIHYGKGQTSDSLSLSPGNYRLTMQFADGWHRSYGESLSSSINVVVQ